MDKINCVFANVRGLNDPTKFNILKRKLLKSSYNIVLISEVKISQNKYIYWGRITRAFDIYEKREITSSLGTIVLIHKSIVSFIHRVTVPNSRTAIIDLSFQNLMIRIISVHFPILSIQRKKYINYIFSNILKFQQNIIIGDFNVNNVYKERIIEERTKEYLLVDIFKIFGQQNRSSMTSIKNVNRLDRIYASKVLLDIISVNYRYLINSDHLAMNIILCNNNKNKSFKQLLYKRNIFQMSCVNYTLLYSNISNFLEEKYLKKMNISFIDKWILIKNIISNIVNESYYEKPNNIQNQIDKLQGILEKSINADTNYNHNMYQLQKQINQLEKMQLDMLYLKYKINDKIMLLNNKFKIINKIKNVAVNNSIVAIMSNDSVFYNQYEIRSVILNYFINITNHINIIDSTKFVSFFTYSTFKYKFFKSNDNIHINQTQINNLNIPFHTNELFSAINSANINASPGPDGFCVKFYKCHFKLLASYMIDAYNCIANDDININHLYLINRAYLIPIVKNSNIHSPTNIESIRPIALMNKDIKFLFKIIYNRLDLIFQHIIPQEITSIKNRGITKSIWIHHLIFYDRIKAYNQDHFMLRVDFTKAFCLLNLNYLDFLINRYLSCSHTTIVLKKILRYKAVSILYNNKYIDFVNLQQGILQGSPISTLLYGFYITELVANIKKYVVGIKVYNLKEKLKVTSFCDDLSIFCSNKFDLNRAIIIIKKFELITGSRINYNKSYVYDLKNCCTLKHHLFTGEHKEILGIYFGNNSRHIYNNFINNKFDLIKRNNNIYNSRSISILNKVKYINTYVIPMFNYFVPFFKFKKKHSDQLKSIITNFLFGKKKHCSLSFLKLTFPLTNGGMSLINFTILYKIITYKSVQKMLSTYEIDIETCNSGIFKYFDSIIKNVIGHKLFLLTVTDNLTNLKYASFYKLWLKQNNIFLNYKNKKVNLKKIQQFNFSNNLSNFAIKFNLYILPTKDFLSKRNMYRYKDVGCLFCDHNIEDLNHLFFQCPKFSFYMRSISHIIQSDKKIKINMSKQNPRSLLQNIPDIYYKWIMVIYYSIWYFRCKTIFEDSKQNLNLIMISNIQREFIMDYSSYTVTWIKKYWSVHALRGITKLHDILNYLNLNNT